MPLQAQLNALQTFDNRKLQSSGSAATDGRMFRKLHRWLGFAAAILFLYVAATGVILQVQQIFGPEEAEKEALAKLTSPVSLSQHLGPDSALEHARLVVFQRFGNRPVDAIDWQIKGPRQFFTFHLGGPDPLKVEVNAVQERITSVESDEEDFFIRLHSGEIIGDGGKVLGLGWGLGLVFMVVTGFVVYLQIHRARQKKERTRGSGWRRWFWGIAGAMLIFGNRANPARADTPQGFSFNPDAGIIYQSGDFRGTAWGYAEGLIDPDGPDYFRRLRQGMELDLPRIAPHLRVAGVYEVDLTDTNAFGINPGRSGSLNSHDFENLYLALQDADDPSKFRVLIGENTHILSHDDSLSSGNLPTINRSLILEEHGSVNSFGTQWGVQFTKALSKKLTLQLAAMDNRGSLNTPHPHYNIGNDVAGKLIWNPLSTDTRKLSIGAALDRTGNIRNRSFNLITAVGQKPLGGVLATGTKTTAEADVSYTFSLGGHPTTLDAEGIYSRFSGSRSDVGGGYLQGQLSLFDHPHMGDLDLFARYDVVSLGIDGISGRAHQEALRTGVNYNLPYTGKLANLHVEYAHNAVHGPSAIVMDSRPPNEFRVELRASLQRYLRH